MRRLFRAVCTGVEKQIPSALYDISDLCYIGRMAIGKSSRIVVEVEDIALKRELYSVLATEGRSLKDWFSSAVNDYLSIHSSRRAARLAEQTTEYHAATKKRK